MSGYKNQKNLSTKQSNIVAYITLSILERLQTYRRWATCITMVTYIISPLQYLYSNRTVACSLQYL